VTRDTLKRVPYFTNFRVFANFTDFTNVGDTL
jgi:hypothetical protein